jgi:4-amino-4-deoxychorismate lyase
MSLLVETIKIENGKLLNISYHNERMIRTLYMIFGIRKELSLENIINVPESASTGVFKCRVIYNDKSLEIEFIPYIQRNVTSLRIIESDGICYPYKYTDRTKINSLFEMREDCDDIIIVKNGMVTDSSYSNLVFLNKKGEWITPANCLLPGTKRAFLLKNNLMAEQEISLADMKNYSEVKLINAMIDIEDTSGIPMGNIR